MHLVWNACPIALSHSSVHPLPPCLLPLPCLPTSAGTLGELLPIARLLGSVVWGHLLAYPAACCALRLLVSWTWPVWVAAATPALWLLRRAVWQPAWWLCLPLSASCYGAAESARVQRHRLLSELLFQGAMLSAVW